MNACRSSNLIPVHASILRWVLLLALVFASAASAKARESDSQAKAFVAGAAAVVTGGHHTCAIGTGGVVMCWGSNQYGQLGNGSIIDSAAPVAVTGVSDANALAAGFTFTCAIISGGAVKCWGSNTYGELGNGSTTGSSLAVDVGDVDGATALAAGNSHACAIVQNGALKCWGKNFDGALGNGNTSSSSVAVDVADVSGAIALVAGSDHTCAVVADGAVHCWGSNRYGQLGTLLAGVGFKDVFFVPKLTRISPAAARDKLKATRAVQKAFIMVDELGTVAAAVTAVGAAGAGMPSSQRVDLDLRDMRFDRPFAYVIREVKSGLILFIGHVVKP